NVDVNQLIINLGGDEVRVRSGVRAFLEGMMHAVPSGKHTASAAQNPPALVMIPVRNKGLWSLANDLLNPVLRTEAEDRTLFSGRAMLTYFGQLAGMYGIEPFVYAGVTTYLPLENLPAPVVRETSVVNLLDGAMNALAQASK